MNKKKKKKFTYKLNSNINFLNYRYLPSFLLFFFNDTATTEIYTLSLHDALPISRDRAGADLPVLHTLCHGYDGVRSEEHTSELQSRRELVCRLLLEKKKEQPYQRSGRTTHNQHSQATKNKVPY